MVGKAKTCEVDLMQTDSPSVKRSIMAPTDGNGGMASTVRGVGCKP